MFDNWLNGRRNNLGIAIAGYNGNVPGGGLLFTREPYGSTMLVIDYVETSGYNAAYSYQQNDILCAGTSYINNFSRQLFVKRSDFAIDGNIMPVELSFMYNSGISQKQGGSSPYGNNWLTNYNRLIYIYESDVGQPYLCYADENGSIKYFTTAIDSDGNPVFKDEFEDVYGSSGISVTYNAPLESDFSLSDIQISNNGYTESFDTLGRLVKITNNHGKYIEITYSDNTDLYKISKIKDGVGREYRFTYKEGKLSYIRCFTANGEPIYAGSSTSVYLKNDYYYDGNGNLERVKYSDGSNAYYMYDRDNLLTEASSRNLYKLSYSYSSDNRIRHVTEYARENTLSSYTTGKSILFANLEPRKTVIHDSCNGKHFLQFDKCGLVSQIVDEKGNVYSAATGSLVPTSQNLLLNTSFENGLTSWNAETESLPAVEAANAYHGNKALKFSTAVNDDGGYDPQAINQEVSVNGGGSYTLSAYVKSTETADDSSLLMAIIAYDENGNGTAFTSRAVSGVANGYQRHDVVLNVPENTKQIQVTIGTEGTQGAFYVDSVQLENKSGASSYNMLDNGSFANGGNGWDIQSNTAYSIADGVINGKARNTVSFDKIYDADTVVSQTVTVNAKEGDVITFGGWISSDTVSNDGNNPIGKLNPDKTNFLNDRFAGLVITYQYFSKDENGQDVLNTVVERRAVNDYLNEWQYLENSVIMLADAETVTVSFEFKKHKSGVEIADFCLSKDSIDYGNAADETDIGELSPEEQEAPSEEPTDESEEFCKCSHCTNARCTCACVNENLCTCETCRKMFDITYDENGNILSITICGYELSELQSISMERAYSADGNYLKSSKNENGNTVLYNYDAKNGLLKSETDAENNLKQYAYSLSGKLAETKTDVSDLTDSGYLRTNYGYLNGNLTTITHNGFTYYIEYDKWNNVERVSANEVSAIINASNVAAYTYNGDKKHDQLKKITYGNGGTVDYTYDEFNRVIGISYDGGATNTVEYTYDTLGNIISVIDNKTGRRIFYNGDTVSVYTDEDTVLYYRGTDITGNVIEYSGGTLYTEKKELDGRKISSGKLETVLTSDTDSFGRVSKKAVELHNVDNAGENPYTKIETNYSYGSYNSSEGKVASGNVKSISSVVSLGENTVKEYDLSYEYDANGNITHEYSGSGEGRKLRYRYTYDEAEQLVRVDDAVQNKTYTYQYDKGGNRVSEKTYAFTTSGTLGAAVETKTSQYDYLLWKDRLSSFNGSEIKYDSAGNPTSYGDKMLWWKGKQLKEISLSDGSKTQFEYDANGLRTQKRQYGTNRRLDYVVDYIWEDGKLQAQYLTVMVYTNFNGVLKANKVGPFSSKIIYDDGGLPQGFMLNDVSQFAFVRNLQGDVIAVIDENGNTAMEYSYDPWGNIEYHLSESFNDEQSALMFTALCPLTYRGYNYDFTTGLYYLQSRYYNPEWGRFINCDDTNILLATQGETHNANLFVYCDNNPVNKADDTGYWAKDVHYGYYITAFRYGIFFTNANYIKINGKYEIYGTYQWARQCGFSDDQARIIGYSNNRVDEDYSPFNRNCQAWHFNVYRNTSVPIDSRLLIAILKLMEADAYFDKALSAQFKNFVVLRDYTKYGLEALGEALHPIQDYYAHTDDVVDYLPILKMWGHVKYPKYADSVSERPYQLMQTKAVTLMVLRETFSAYKKLFLDRRVQNYADYKFR